MNQKINLMDSDILLDSAKVNDKIKFAQTSFSAISNKIFTVKEIINYSFAEAKIKVLSLTNESLNNLFITIDSNGDYVFISRKISEDKANSILDYKNIKSRDKEFFKATKTNSEIDEWLSNSYSLENKIRTGKNESAKEEFNLLCLSGSEEKNIDIEIYKNCTKIFLVIFCGLDVIEYIELAQKQKK